MKCEACKYEYEYHVNCQPNYEIITDKGDEDFININGSFHITKDYGYKNKILEADILACPKCGTLKLGGY